MNSRQKKKCPVSRAQGSGALLPCQQGSHLRVRLKYLSVFDTRETSTPSPLFSVLDMTFPRSTQCERGFNLLKLYLFVFHNTDTSYRPPPLVLDLSVTVKHQRLKQIWTNTRKHTQTPTPLQHVDTSILPHPRKLSRQPAVRKRSQNRNLLPGFKSHSCHSRIDK